MRPKLYVDADFKATRSFKNRMAIVNVTSNGAEIMFLKPVAHNATLSDAWKHRGLWGMRNYPQYKACLPSVKICFLANMAEKYPIVTDCHTGTSIDDYHGRIDNWYAINAEGEKYVDRGGILKNVYVSLWLSKEDFFAINPNLRFDDYQFCQDY